MRISRSNDRLSIFQICESWLIIFSGMAATHFLPNLVGPSTAAALLLTGKIIGAEEALNSGLVSKVNRECLFISKPTVYYVSFNNINHAFCRTLIIKLL